jgi:hypothetical protein
MQLSIVGEEAPEHAIPPPIAELPEIVQWEIVGEEPPSMIK